MEDLQKQLDDIFRKFGVNPTFESSTLPIFEDVQSSIITKLRESFLQLPAIMQKMKVLALEAIILEKGQLDLIKCLRKEFENLGYSEQRLNSGLEFARTHIYDTYAQVNRLVNFEYANACGLKYAQYSGGIVGDSRQFCIERNRKLFHIDEIRSWKDLEFEGKPLNYDPIRDCGGYNCRHQLLWTTDEAAEILNK